MTKKKDRIRYKVVSFGRLSTNAYFTNVTKVSKYIKRYKKGSTVKSIKGSLGIFVFKTQHQARDFQKYHALSHQNGGLILTVKAIGEMKIPENISGVLDTFGLTKFYMTPKESQKMYPVPRGSECYPKVEVLD